MRIEVRRPFEHLDRDRVPLQSVATAGQRLLDNEGQKFAGPARGFGLWVRLLRVPYRMLFPAIMIFCCIGSVTVVGDIF